MSDPIVLRSEILSLLQSGGLGNAGTSGQSTLASLNSQLISLTSRIAKLESSATYQENDAPTSNWEYLADVGVCYAAGNVILTQDYTTTQAIKLATIDSQYLPKNTEFVGVANVYDSAASQGVQPQELRMGFEGNILYAYPESYISATTNSTMFLEFSTMWFPASDLTNSSSNYTRTEYSFDSSYCVSDASRYYAQTHSSGGVHFFCVYGKLLNTKNMSGGSAALINKSAPLSTSNWNTTVSNASRKVGRASVREPDSNTVHQGTMYMQNSISHIGLDSFPAITTYGCEVYCWGLAFDATPSNVSLGQYESALTPESGISTYDNYSHSVFFRYGTFHFIEFCSLATLGTSSTWSETKLFTSSKLSTSATVNNAMYLDVSANTNAASRYPLNISRGSVKVSLKPNPSISNKKIHAAIIFLHDTAQ